ncbi:oligosaccharide flippase family protein [Vibrio parahaemolyticus]|nr:oligosaccharide flippase family protein [Vibrio parahaemolyticus]EJF4090742.1 oligosaccharide flippase family protein [Vibrio parahaemolyticus]EJG0648440.1 oligosaccharide flippase family protein [Vibrio parahaemolyticus]
MLNKNMVINAIWIILERFTVAFGTLFITIYTARYLGPEKSGLLFYFLSIGTAIVPFCQLGSQSLIFDKTIKNQAIGIRLLINSQKVRLLLYLISSAFIVIGHKMSGYESQSIYFLVLVLIACSFLCVDSYKPYYDAILKSKFNTITSQLGMLAAHLTRLLLIYLKLPLLFFSIPYIINYSIPFFIKRNRFKKENNIYAVYNKKRFVRYSIVSGIPLAISAASVAIYLKINQVLLGNLLDMKSVGIYSAAVTIAQSWIFLPIALMTVLLTKLIGNENKLKYIYILCSIVSFLVVFAIVFLKEYLIGFSYGSEFTKAQELLLCLSIASFFSVLGTINNRIMINKSGFRFILIKSILLIFVSPIASYLFIKTYGIYGAAYFMLFIEFFSSIIIDSFYRKGYFIRMQIK